VARPRRCGSGWRRPAARTSKCSRRPSAGQLLELGLIDEIDLHIAPILLGEGIRLYDNPGGEPIHLHRVDEGDPTSAVNVRYRPTTTAKIPTREGVG
jgi:hypothetical protein